MNTSFEKSNTNKHMDTHTLVSWSGVDAECDLDGSLDACATALHRDPCAERFMLRRIGHRVTRPEPRGNGTPARASSTLDLPLLWSPMTQIFVCWRRENPSLFDLSEGWEVCRGGEEEQSAQVS